MAASCTSTSAAYYKVPDWAVKNKEIFLRAGEKACVARPHPAIREERTLLPSLSLADDARANLGAKSMAVLGAEVENAIVAPLTPPGADYFRDVANHPDVLSTIISTARQTVGFLPQLTGADLTPEQAQEYLDKFRAFLTELDRYYVYLNMTAASAKTIPNDTTDCSAMLKAIAAVVESAMGVQAATSKDLTKRISKLIRLAVDNVLQVHKTTTASFEMVGLPASNVQGEDPSRNPSSAVTFCSNLQLSKHERTRKSTLDDTHITIRAFSYQLKSSAIIEYAEDLAGAQITGNQALANFINTPFN